MLYCFYFSDTEAFEACFRLLHDDDDDDDVFWCAVRCKARLTYRLLVVQPRNETYLAYLSEIIEENLVKVNLF